MKRSGAPLPAENAARYFASKSAYGIWTGLRARFPPGNFCSVWVAQYGPIFTHWSLLTQMVSAVLPAAGGAAGFAASAGLAGAAAAGAGAVVAAGAAAGAAGFAASAGL